MRSSACLSVSIPNLRKECSVNDLSLVDNDPTDIQEWNKLCEVLRSWEPEENRKRDRWKWLIKNAGFDNFMRLSALSVERRHAAVMDARRLHRVEPGLLAIISSERSLNETKTPSMSEEMLDELGL